MNKLIKTILILGVAIIPSFSFAATIKIDLPETINTGDTVLAKILLDTEGEKINVIEGDIYLENVSVTEINLGGSVFPFWPNKPSLEDNKISFVGGVPEYVKGKGLKVFEIAIKPNDLGEVKIKTDNIKVYKNDGNGTAINISSSESKSIAQIGKGEVTNELLTLIQNDRKSPEKFEIRLGQDENTFDGQYFITFNAIDKESGIDRYEITEGDFPSVRSGNTYVLRDQSLNSKVIVKAFDEAGNERTITFNPQKKSNTLTYILLIITLIVVVVIIKNRFNKINKWRYIRRV